ncbi:MULTISPECIES: MarR family winged helix-turn-helix transcriptional regulator [unclassified Massilia]|uniref:MarR family winged helix-turn-helix transcriptional regulator n=1 Tax=unclassified Massilia TaxID=2609279 RepID=UPI001784EEBB|nr:MULTISPECIES: MarR family transcriptional regulator [unclassified Massilia]MBD8530527.1 MarR family transcriptional regulator [Massilia sp. CFBP 13647]MBD8674175.1 MarR family transcriptional regulator [Massilia sp. CFBP 13721]
MTTSKKLSVADAAASAIASDATRPTGLAYLVGRLDHVLNQRLRDACAPAGLSVPQYTALSVFRAHGALSNAQLATRTMISPQSANEMVKQMEAKGWIARTPDPAHGRIIQISLTAAGEAVLGECDARVAEVERMMFAELDEAGRGALLGQLRGAVRALSVQGI